MADDSDDVDERVIAEALESADIPTLMVVIAQLTGDMSLLRGDVRPAPGIYVDRTGGIAESDQAAVRARALEVLCRHRAEGQSLPPALPDDVLAEMMSFCIGERIPDEYVPMMLGEMALEGSADAFAWDEKPSDEALRAFHVLVIGAGMSGICAAIKLSEAGIPYTIIEKNETVGGTWLENTYPGCRVDVPNHFYSYSFEPNHQWTEFFSQRDELQAYFEHCATKYGVRSNIRFRTEVVSARYDEARARWMVEVRTPDGEAETIEAGAIISAVGQLNRPKIPAVDGLASFAGQTFHSARWPTDLDLAGKRVAVVGNGASAMQFVPIVAEQAERLVVFQRSPEWASFHPDYFATVSEGKKWLLEHVPYYARWYRFRHMWSLGDGMYEKLQVDPAWTRPDVSLNAANDRLRVLFTRYIESQIGDDAELREKVIPRYPPFGKRMLIDNGWFRTLTRDDVDLVTDPIRSVTPTAVVTEAGDEYPVDVIVFATGFHTHRFLWPMRIEGRAGIPLGEVWGENPRAYLGITVPGFPNLFCLYGPNTNLAHGGSIIFHTECQVRYVMGCLKALLQRGRSSLECRQDVHDAYNERVDAAHAHMVWAHAGVQSWYKNADGRVTTNSPWRLVDYWSMTRAPDLDDFIVA